MNKDTDTQSKSENNNIDNMKVPSNDQNNILNRNYKLEPCLNMLNESEISCEDNSLNDHKYEKNLSRKWSQLSYAGEQRVPQGIEPNADSWPMALDASVTTTT